jgi:hypothetical protein
VMGRHEGGDEVGTHFAECFADGPCRLHDGVIETRLLRKRRSPPHASLSATRLPEVQRERRMIRPAHGTGLPGGLPPGAHAVREPYRGGRRTVE